MFVTSHDTVGVTRTFVTLGLGTWASIRDFHSVELLA